MSRINMFNFSAALLSGVVGVWTGIKFFEPIIVEQLRKDGNLRDDMQFAQYDEEGEVILPDGVEKPDIFKMISGEQKVEQTTLADDMQQKLAEQAKQLKEEERAKKQ